MSSGVWGVILACGKSEELTPEAETAFLHMGDRPVLVYTLLAFEECEDIEGVVLIARKERLENIAGMAGLFGCSKLKKVVAGSAQRNVCIQNALKAIDDETAVVVLHEASRPCVEPDLISQTVKAAKRYGSGVAAYRIEEPVKVVEKGLKASNSLPSRTAWMVQTPQAYKLDELQKAIQSAKKKRLKYDEESVAYARAYKAVHLVPAPRSNLKISNADELLLASCILRL